MQGQHACTTATLLQLVLSDRTAAAAAVARMLLSCDHVLFDKRI
jgi:hypothetical protein